MAAYTPPINPITHQPNYPEIYHNTVQRRRHGSPLASNNLLALAYKLYGTPAALGGLRHQAAGYVQTAMDPLIAAIAKKYAAQAESGGSAISDITAGYAKSVADLPQQVGGIWDRAIGQVGAMNSALGSAITAGGSIGNDLSAQLASAGQDTGPAADVQALGQSAGNIALAQNVSAQEGLVGQRAPWQSYAETIPGNIKARGLDALAAFKRQIAQQQSDEIGGLTAQVPGMVNDLYTSLLSNRTAQQGNIADFLSAGLDRRQAALQSAATLRATVGQNAAENAIAWAQNAIDQQNADTAAWSAHHPPPGSSAAAVDPMAPPSGKDYSDLVSYMHGIVFPNAALPGQPVKPLPWQQAYQALITFLRGSYSHAPAGWADQQARKWLKAWGVTPPAQPNPPPKGHKNQPGFGNPPPGAPGSEGGTAPERIPPKPKNHPSARYMPDGPKGPGWYEPHQVTQAHGRAAGQSTIWVKVG